MRSGDLAPLFGGDRTTGRMVYGQGTIVSFNPETFENVVDWNRVELRNLPVLAGTVALSFTPGQTVALLGWDPGNRRGNTSWWILGRLIVPGGTVDSETILGTLTADIINVRQLNADEVFVDGKELGALVEEETSEPSPGTHTKTYNAAWSQNYRGNGSRNDFDPRPHQGFFSSTNGNQRSLIGFPTSQIQSDLTNATSVTRVEVYLYFSHWYFNGGGTAILGHHGHTSAPSTFSASTDNVREANWPKPGGRWVDYDVGMDDWIDGTKAGIALGPGPSTSRTYYGRARGAGESNGPRLRITWTE